MSYSRRTRPRCAAPLTHCWHSLAALLMTLHHLLTSRAGEPRRTNSNKSASIFVASSSPVASRSWLSQYEYGSVVQLWGDTPPCTTKGCVNGYSGLPECCTQPCYVPGIPTEFVQPNATFIDPASQGLGLSLLMTGEAYGRGFDSYFYNCNTDPSTGTWLALSQHRHAALLNSPRVCATNAYHVT